MDNLRLCSVCGDQETSSESGKCHSCRTQEQIDNYDFAGWVFCPSCQSGLVIQHDWTKPIYVCELCNHEFTDPDGEWIVICEKCGYAMTEGHDCFAGYDDLPY